MLEWYAKSALLERPGGPWGPLGTSWGLLGASLGLLGFSWDPLGRSWSALGASLSALEGILGVSWEALGRILDASGGPWEAILELEKRVVDFVKNLQKHCKLCKNQGLEVQNLTDKSTWRLRIFIKNLSWLPEAPK